MRKIGGIFFKKKHLNERMNILEDDKMEKYLSNQWFVINEYDNLVLFSDNKEIQSSLYSTQTNDLYHIGFAYPNKMPQSSEIDQEFEFSKTKFIAQIFEKFGKKSLNHVNGKFNILKYNKSDKSVEIHNDILGLYKLYYYEDEKTFIFSTDYEFILICNSKIKEKLSKSAIMEYLLLGAPQNNKTFFEDINSLAPASIIELRNNNVKIYTSIKKILIREQKLVSMEDMASFFFKEFKKELDLLLAWHPHLKITLTGGADSRLTFGAMSEKDKKRREFVTFSSQHIENADNQDIIIASKIAEKFDLKHHIINNQIFSISSLNNQYFHSLRRYEDVYISGFLGSESLQFFFPYSNNISEITRDLLSSKRMDYEYKTLFIKNLEQHTGFKRKVKVALKEIEKYINDIGSVKSKTKNLYSEILNSIKPIKSSYKEVPYTNLYLSRSFFSRHCGGARSSLLMPSSINSLFLSPFESLNILRIIWGISPKHLNSFNTGLVFHIFKNHLKELSQIESNSTLSMCNDEVLPFITYGKNAVYETKVIYPSFDLFGNNKFLKKHSSIFKFDAINEDFFQKDKSNQHIWTDLFLWLSYVDSI